tara:strand:- start:238 stop:1143 length:906 start_codon:yes stop_codon:yes gene_type:complete
MALVLTTDLSTLRDTMNSALNGTGVGGGYNQSHTVASNPAVGDNIDDSYMDSIFSAAAKLANYYNITNPFTAVNAGDTITEAQYKDHASSFNTSVAARIADPHTYSSGWDMTTATETTESVSDWNGTREQIVSVSFADANTMNAWFSAGGEIRVSASHNDTSGNQQGTSWEQLTTELGTFRISLRDTDTTTVADSIRKKYSDLSDQYAEIKKEYADDSDYSANYIAIEAKKTNESVFVKIILADAHVARSGSGSGYGGPWSFTGHDQVVGTSTVNVSSLKLSNATGSVNITNPTFTVTDSL